MIVSKYKISKIEHVKCCDEKIVIGADFVPTDSNKELFQQGNYEVLFGNQLFSLLMESSVRVFNLEAPLTNRDISIEKEGSPAIKASPETVPLFACLKPVILSGANNHIRDYGEEGIIETKSILRQNKIDFVGFGEKNNIKKFHILHFQDLVVGIYAFAENELSVDWENMSGANGFDLYETFDEIQEYKKQCDYLIVLFHGGCENYRYQTPNQKRICRKIVDKGADIVICQHSHCIGTYEKYKNSIIVYGQGNFLFDRLSIEEWMTSILIEIDFKEQCINIIPIIKDRYMVRLASKHYADKIFKDFYERSMRCQDEEFLNYEWRKFVDSQKNILLLRGIMGIRSPLLLGINKLLGGLILTKLFSKRRKKLLYNYLRCESIRERIVFLLRD